MNKNGFTLLEVIFVLGIWALFILLSTPIQFSILEKHEEQQFFKMFEFDMLFMQNISYTTTDYIRLEIKDNHTYSITRGKPGKTILERKIPADWTIDKRTMTKPISFNAYGTLKQSGTLAIKTNRAKYVIIFPLGKGRCYIEKQ